MIHSLLLTHQIAFFVLLFIFFLMTITFIIRSNMLARCVLTLEKIVFGSLGVFLCANNHKNYSFLGMELKSNLATAVCVSIGIWVLSLHYVFYLHLLAIGVPGVWLLATPFVLYLAYPLIMFSLRKKCD